jgi:chromate reductase, NAD(P)H dehydrogenase (quinone)
MARFVGLGGSLRRGSFNAALLRAARELVPAGMEVEILGEFMAGFAAFAQAR